MTVSFVKGGLDEVLGKCHQLLTEPTMCLLRLFNPLKPQGIAFPHYVDPGVARIQSALRWGFYGSFFALCLTVDQRMYWLNQACTLDPGATHIETVLS